MIQEPKAILTETLGVIATIFRLTYAMTDNGGPTYWAPPGPEDTTYPHGGGANNWDLFFDSEMIRGRGQDP